MPRRRTSLLSRDARPRSGALDSISDISVLEVCRCSASPTSRVDEVIMLDGRRAADDIARASRRPLTTLTAFSRSSALALERLLPRRGWHRVVHGAGEPRRLQGRISIFALRRGRARLFPAARSIYQSLLGWHALEAKDAYTRGHSERVSELARRIAVLLGLEVDEVIAIGEAGLLHDIGKIGVPEPTLRKPGPLTAEEWQAMRRHPLVGAQIVAPFECFARSAALIRHHHERWDGSVSGRSVGAHSSGARSSRSPTFRPLTSGRPTARRSRSTPRWRTFSTKRPDARRTCLVCVDWRAEPLLRCTRLRGEPSWSSPARGTPVRLLAAVASRLVGCSRRRALSHPRPPSAPASAGLLCLSCWTVARHRAPRGAAGICWRRGSPSAPGSAGRRARVLLARCGVAGRRGLLSRLDAPLMCGYARLRALGAARRSPHDHCVIRCATDHAPSAPPGCLRPTTLAQVLRRSALSWRLFDRRSAAVVRARRRCPRPRACAVSRRSALPRTLEVAAWGVLSLPVMSGMLAYAERQCAASPPGASLCGLSLLHASLTVAVAFLLVTLPQRTPPGALPATPWRHSICPRRAGGRARRPGGRVRAACRRAAVRRGRDPQIERAGATRAVIDARDLRRPPAGVSPRSHRARRHRAATRRLAAHASPPSGPADLCSCGACGARAPPRLRRVGVVLVEPDGPSHAAPLASAAIRSPLASSPPRSRLRPDAGRWTAQVGCLSSSGRRVTAAPRARAARRHRAEDATPSRPGNRSRLALENARLAQPGSVLETLERKVARRRRCGGDLSVSRRWCAGLALAARRPAIHGFSEGSLATRPFSTGEVRRVANRAGVAERLALLRTFSTGALERGLPWPSVYRSICRRCSDG